MLLFHLTCCSTVHCQITSKTRALCLLMTVLCAAIPFVVWRRCSRTLGLGKFTFVSHHHRSLTHATWVCHLHLCPKLTFPSGIDMKTKAELAANQTTLEQLCNNLNADSLKYLSHEGLLKAVNKYRDDDESHPSSFCSACFTGDYPLEVSMPDIEDLAGSK